MTEAETPAARRRIDNIDALRGLAVLLMVAHHLLFDLVEFLGAAGLVFLQIPFSTSFIRFSRGSLSSCQASRPGFQEAINRGVKVLAIAALFTIVTSQPFVGEPRSNSASCTFSAFAWSSTA
jgi:uncharacterized membrane protein